jgi:aminoglycoside 6-adenylyltransferase
MRNETEMMELILKVAKADERIRAVLLSGSRANPAAPKDKYQDYDITYFVTDIKPYYNKPQWITEQFGKPLIMQMPETMRFPEGDGNFNYLIIFTDGVRLDLSFEFKKYIDDGEPALTLLDKDGGKGFLPFLGPPKDDLWHIYAPSEHYFVSCCNEFWWCLNNAAKGLARDELPYVMYMLNDVIRPELHNMIDWYIGTVHGFSFSTGKNSKYIKSFLPLDLYEQYVKTYSSGDYDEIWESIDTMCELFHTLALSVAEHFGFCYCQEEEDGMMKYLQMVKEC